ncbi:hypothetical protein [Methylobacterium sp. CM6244]
MSKSFIEFAVALSLIATASSQTFAGNISPIGQMNQTVLVPVLSIEESDSIDNLLGSFQ